MHLYLYNHVHVGLSFDVSCVKAMLHNMPYVYYFSHYMHVHVQVAIVFTLPLQVHWYIGNVQNISVREKYLVT